MKIILIYLLIILFTPVVWAKSSPPSAKDYDYYRSFMEAKLAQDVCSDWHVEMNRIFFSSYKFSKKLSDKEIEIIFKETAQRHTSLIQTDRLEFCDTYLDHIRNTYKKDFAPVFFDGFNRELLKD